MNQASALGGTSALVPPALLIKPPAKHLAKLARPAIVRGLRIGDNFMFAGMPTNLATIDQSMIDSTGAFFVSELLRLDQTEHMPLVATYWERDMDLRSDVTMGDEESGFTNSGFAAAGGVNPTGINWASMSQNATPAIEVDIGLTKKPLRPWAIACPYTIFELATSMQLGRPIDAQKVRAIDMKWMMDVDQMVFIGDTTVGAYGLCNSTAITPANVAAGAQGTLTWATKTPSEILADVNEALSASMVASGTAVVPSELRLPTTQYGLIASTPVSTAASASILKWVSENCIAANTNGKPLNIQQIKWLSGRGAGSTDRMIAYTRNPEMVRYPLVPKQFTPVQFRDIWQSTTYFGRLGELEIPYPTTIAYRDGI